MITNIIYEKKNITYDWNSRRYLSETKLLCVKPVGHRTEFLTFWISIYIPRWKRGTFMSDPCQLLLMKGVHSGCVPRQGFNSNELIFWNTFTHTHTHRERERERERRMGGMCMCSGYEKGVSQSVKGSATPVTRTLMDGLRGGCLACVRPRDGVNTAMVWLMAFEVLLFCVEIGMRVCGQLEWSFYFLITMLTSVE